MNSWRGMNRILIVDDDAGVQILYADELTEEGYDVVLGADVSRLLELIEEKKPDLVLLEVRLGQYNGLDLLQDIRNTYYDLPVILCTMCHEFKYDPRSIAADYDVVKSSDLGELKLRVRMAMEAGLEPPHGSGAAGLNEKNRCATGWCRRDWD